MGRGKSKTTKKDTKKRNIVIAFFLAVIFAVFFLMALNPHPGYSQLEKELDKIVLPDGWTEVGPRTGEKDYWNMFCRDVTIKCPSISTTVDTTIKSHALDEFKKIAQQNGYTVVDASSKCLPFDSVTGSRCYVRSTKKNIILSITLNDYGNSSFYSVGVSLRKSSEK
ncbi:MAG TPA: hypothetical protein PKB09_00090 [Candidatus Saccharibacteria bacterium]|nr:hypothetical protein [Candidatus Saccharibacteria bacterium]